MFIDLFRRFGCNYLNMNGLPENYTMPPEQPLFWPANFGVGVNPCIINGYYYPVKPMSYFCPVSCGCRAGDLHCPDTCPARIAEANVIRPHNRTADKLLADLLTNGWRCA